MFDLQARMINAILEGQGLRGVAELAALEAGGPVAIVLPARGLGAASDDRVRLEGHMRFAASRLRGRSGSGPDSVRAREPVMAGPDVVGYVLALRRGADDGPDLPLDVGDVLRQ